MKANFLPVMFATWISIARAAEGTPATPAQLAAEGVAVQSARAAAQRNDPAAAEQLLTAANRAHPDTSWWHFETAQRLIQLAHDVPREGPRGNAIPALVTSALQHLAMAENATSDARHKSSIQSFAGLIYERFRGDHASALASYQAAVNLAADNPLAAKHAERLQRLAANQAAGMQK
jgi:hypothetical protein